MVNNSWSRQKGSVSDCKWSTAGLQLHCIPLEGSALGKCSNAFVTIRMVQQTGWTEWPFSPMPVKMIIKTPLVPCSLVRPETGCHAEDGRQTAALLSRDAQAKGLCHKTWFWGLTRSILDGALEAKTRILKPAAKQAGTIGKLPLDFGGPEPSLPVIFLSSWQQSLALYFFSSPPPSLPTWWIIAWASRRLHTNFILAPLSLSLCLFSWPTHSCQCLCLSFPPSYNYNQNSLG